MNATLPVGQQLDGDCLLCRKHRRLEQPPPGGYVFEDGHWKVCHAPPNLGPLGTLFIVSARHFLDYAEMSDAEASAFGFCLRSTYGALRGLLGPERIYQLSSMEGVAHFHCWLVPRLAGEPARGLKFLALDATCREEEASALADRLRRALQA